MAYEASAVLVMIAVNQKFVNIMFGEEYGIPMSVNTISPRIQDMSQDVESGAIANIKKVDFFPSTWASQLTSLENLNS
jgi:hypothetical protein